MAEIYDKIDSYIHQGNGAIVAIKGPMKSGKSNVIREEIIKQLDHSRWSEQFLKFIPSIDNREQGQIKPRESEQPVDAIMALDIGAIVERCSEKKDLEVIIIDEGQFFKGEQYQLLYDYCRRQKVVAVVAALDMDFTGRPFQMPGARQSIGYLFSLANAVFTLSGRCEYKIHGKDKCGFPGTRTFRGMETPNNLFIPALSTDPVVMVGYGYYCVCAQHHVVPDSEPERDAYMALRNLDSRQPDAAFDLETLRKAMPGGTEERAMLSALDDLTRKNIAVCKINLTYYLNDVDGINRR